MEADFKRLPHENRTTVQQGFQRDLNHVELSDGRRAVNFAIPCVFLFLFDHFCNVSIFLNVLQACGPSVPSLNRHVILQVEHQHALEHGEGG